MHRCLALKGAYDAGILHCDFSVGNIIIDSEGQGWLIDWDLSKPVSSPVASETPKHAARTVSDVILPAMVNANSECGPQGTWQFMSAKLISSPNAQHDFRDDLESSIYVLMWMTLMYSEVSERGQVEPFLSNTLNPPSYDDLAGFARQDFLKGQSFLQHVKFPGRPALHSLICNLADLFRFRYEPEPSEQLKQEYEVLQQLVSAEPTNKAVKAAYRKDPYRLYAEAITKLNDHTATIRLFGVALDHLSGWPVNDDPAKPAFEPESPADPVVKSSWRSTRTTGRAHV